MRGLTIFQPWAQLIALRQKRVETRPKRTHYRGLVAIHAAAGMPPMPELSRLKPVLEAVRLPWDLSEYPRGAVVAVARIAGCGPADQVAKLVRARQAKGQHPEHELIVGDFSPHRWGWLLDEIIPLGVPYPLRGQQGLFPIAVDHQVKIKALMLKQPTPAPLPSPAAPPPREAAAFEIPTLEESKPGVMFCPQCDYAENGSDERPCPSCTLTAEGV